MPSDRLHCSACDTGAGYVLRGTECVPEACTVNDYFMIWDDVCYPCVEMAGCSECTFDYYYRGWINCTVCEDTFTLSDGYCEGGDPANVNCADNEIPTEFYGSIMCIPCDM